VAAVHQGERRCHAANAAARDEDVVGQ
jgi:hypothetical protein